MVKQKLNVKRVANTLAVVTAVAYVVCIVLIWISMEFSTALGNYLIHGIELAGIMVYRDVGFSLVSLVLGTAIAWIFGAFFALVYNKL